MSANRHSLGALSSVKNYRLFINILYAVCCDFGIFVWTHSTSVLSIHKPHTLFSLNASVGLQVVDYADYLMIVATGLFLVPVRQEALKFVFKWCCRIKFAVKPGKIEVMICTRNSK